MHYPGLESHPQHALARNQMHGGFGGIVSIDLDTDIDGARRFLEACEVFTLAESLGGVESLIEHPALMTHASIPPERRAELGIGDGLIRLSVGIEHIDDQREDLRRALAAILLVEFPSSSRMTLPPTITAWTAQPPRRPHPPYANNNGPWARSLNVATSADNSAACWRIEAAAAAASSTIAAFCWVEMSISAIARLTCVTPLA